MNLSEPPPLTRTTRLAPSPTGALHLGNARTFLINWALARRQDWRIVLRIEDLDGPRIKPGADMLALMDLQWLGVDWDEGPFYQRRDLSPYLEALNRLLARELAYPCACTRRDIEQAQSAPHAEDHELRYPGTCRGKRDPRCGGGGGGRRLLAGEEEEGSPAWRLKVPEGPIEFVDEIHGPQSIDVQGQVGDFVVATKAGLPAYQLAVVVDDARQGITDVVRGEDLLGSAGRQLWLYRLLEIPRTPRYWHLPLVLGPDGRRLAKRHGDTRLAWYRGQSVPAERIIGLIAWWCGAAAQRAPMAASEFAARFELARLPRAAVTMTPEDHAWLVD